MDGAEHVGQGVIGYSPDGGYLIQGRRQDKGQFVPIGPDDFVEIAMADALDQRIFGVGGDDPVVLVKPKWQCEGTVRRYLARYSWFELAPADKSRNGR